MTVVHVYHSENAAQSSDWSRLVIFGAAMFSLLSDSVTRRLYLRLLCEEDTRDMFVCEQWEVLRHSPIKGKIGPYLAVESVAAEN